MLEIHKFEINNICYKGVVFCHYYSLNITLDVLVVIKIEAISKYIDLLHKNRAVNKKGTHFEN